ncbi:sensor histidine kinase [Kitasatospora sp. NPDC004531]
MPRDTPLRRSLTARLLALSALVSLCSIAATAWLAARTTTGAIQQEQTQAIADHTRIYRQLLGYAATHPDWNDAQDTVRQLAAATGQRIVLTTPGFEPVLDSTPGQGGPALPRTPTGIVDPLSVDLALQPDAPADRIDARAAGPFRPTPDEQRSLRNELQQQADCLRATLGVEATVTDDPAGRPRLRTPDSRPLGVRCSTPMVASAPTRTEDAALADLTGLVNACLARRQLPPVALELGPDGVPVADPGEGRAVSACLTNARRQQLVEYVAPPLLLFVGTPAGPADAAGPAPVLTAAHPGRVTEVAALVLVVTVAVTLTVGLRLSRPLHALTHAARRMADGDLTARVRVTGRNEISMLAAAFNAMAERRKQLEDLRKAMVGDIAHELRTPLSNIRGWLEAVEDGLATADRALTGSLLEEAMLLQHLIDDLRDLAAADAGELVLHREPVDVGDLLAQVAGAHGAQARAAAVALAVETSPAAAEVFADPVRLRQAVGNLVSNAVRHTPPGGAVTLRARTEGAALLLQVADTGTGIAEADLPLVFERFWRADRSRTRQTGGTGLGLAIVRKLAELHGGDAHAASTPGAGSTFTLRLPLEPGALRGTTPPSRSG